MVSNALGMDARQRAGAPALHIELWLLGIILDLKEELKTEALGEYPSVIENATVAAAELGRLTASGKIFRCQHGCHPPDQRALPS